jgi:RNA polymerase sigma-70 factor (ECF subfamily)
MTLPLWFTRSSEDGNNSDPLLPAREPREPILHRTAADEPLLTRLRAGEERAFRELIDAHGPALLALATAVTGRAELGDDVVQQVFIRLWDHRETLTVRDSLRQYLWRATRNQAITVRRHEQMHQRIATAAGNEPSARNVASNVGEAELDAAALLTQIRAALEALPARCREIFLLNWRDALTPSEIADALGIGIATVRNQLLRATKHLGQQFGR